MAAKYSLGDSVTVKVNGLPYLGTVITYDESVVPIVYRISVVGGDTLAIDEDTLDEMSSEDGQDE